MVYSSFQGITDIRIDRKALPNAVRRFWSILSRLPNILVKGSWRNIDHNLTVASRAKLEALLSVGMHCDFPIIFVYQTCFVVSLVSASHFLL